MSHLGLPLILGVCTSHSPFLLITQFHGVDGKCITLNIAVKTTLLDKMTEWARVFKGIAEALVFLHSKHILHNDIKGDNVIISGEFCFHPVIIDFGKARKVCNAKLYSLTKSKQELYFKLYWHIAPEVVRGIHSQSFASDVFSYGVLLKRVLKLKQFDSLMPLARNCIHDNPQSRPKLSYICDHLSLYIK